MKLKKMVSSLLAVTIMAGMLVGCGGGTAPEANKETTQKAADQATDKTSGEAKGETSGENVTIQMFTRFSDGASKAFFEQAAAAFHEKNPNITVELSSADNANYKPM